MAITKDDILEAVGQMSVMDLNDLVKAFEEKFGVSAAAMAVAGPAGAGGGGAYFYRWTYEENIPYLGPRNGGNAGATQGKKGEDGYAVFPSIGACGGGFGATQTEGGSAGSDLGSENLRALPGTIFGGGRAQYTNPAHLTPYGIGGGGGGGKYGGGGGAFDGGGGGGSSTTDTEYCFDPSENCPANYCNPFLGNDKDLGGRKLPINSSTTGTDGQITQYYIKGFCYCDTSKNQIPDPMFICLDANQFAYLIKELGPTPPPVSSSGNYQRLFSYNNEEYILLGICDQLCEQIYKVPVGSIFTSIRWEWRENNTGEGTEGAPPCCSQIVCRPVCPVAGAACASCGCEDYNDTFVCCDTNGKPDEYTAVYNGWIYSCIKSNQSWTDPGVDINVTELCLTPQEIECSADQNNCDQSISEEYQGCRWDDISTCQASVNVLTPEFTIAKTGTPSDECPYESSCFPPLVTRVSHTFNFPPYPSESGRKGDCPYKWNAEGNLSFVSNQAWVERAPFISIKFDCIPPECLGGG